MLAQRIFYQALKLYCCIALFFFFRKWQVTKQANIPDGPVIFVANHQNAFLDAVLVICSSYRNPWALARANVFKNKWAYKALSFIQMMPVYRFRDGFDTLRKNEAIMDTCAQLLQKNKSILIFGEGNHNERYTLLPLQKGFARIAQGAAQLNVAVQIVPVGIYYEAHRTFRSRVLINFGTAIPLSSDYFNDNPVVKTELLLNQVSAALKPLTLTIPETDYDKRFALWQTNRIMHASMAAQLKSDQHLVNTSSVIPHNNKTTAPQWAQKIIRAYYSVNHWLPRKIVRYVTGKPKLDPQFIGSLKFAIGMVTVPLFYVLQTGTVFLLSGSGWVTLVYLVSLPLSLILLKPK